MKTKELAAALGVTRQAIEKYTQEKRQQLTRDINAGVKPSVHSLIGELASECYRASCYMGRHVQYEAYYAPTGGHFCVNYQAAGDDKLTYLVDCFADINPINLSGAITKVQELIK